MTRRLLHLLLWVLACWSFDLAVSSLLGAHLSLIFQGLTDAELQEPGGMMMLEALRLNYNELFVIGRRMLLLLGASLPLKWALAYPLLRAAFGLRDGGALSRPNPAAVARFYAWTVFGAVAQVLLLGVTCWGVLAALSSEFTQAQALSLSIFALWVVGRGLPVSYFELAQTSAAAGGDSFASSHHYACEQLARRGLRVALTRSLLTPVALSVTLLSLTLSERALDAGTVAFGGSVIGVQVALLLALGMHVAWLVWANARSDAPRMS